MYQGWAVCLRLIGLGVIISSDSPLPPRAVACRGKGISLLGYLYSFEDILI